MMSGSARRGLIVSRAWIQASVLVMLFGFGVIGTLAYGAHDGAPPVPDRVVDPSGGALFTAADIVGGQETFLRNGLMEYGSIFGHGAYLGPDYTADALRREALDVLEQYGGPASDQARARTLGDFKTNRYQAASGTLSVESTITTAIRGPAPNGLGDWGTGNWALNLAGPTTLSGPGGLYVAGSAVLNNTGTFTVQGAGVSINYAACCPRFTNAGTLINDSGSNTTTISAELANTGTIALDPPDPTILQGATQQFTATGSYGDGSSFDLSLWVTWGSQDMTIASIDGAGLATGIGPGTTAISAVTDTISGATSLTVVSPAAPSTIRHRAGPAIGPRHMTPPAPGHAARPPARAHTRGHASLHP